MNKKLSLVKSTLVKNFLALSTLQVVNLILPFLTLPYLTRVLGISNYGVVVMVYSVMQFLLVICDYGFNLSATKDVSLNRNDKKEINIIFSSVLTIKFFLIFISFLILFLLTNFVEAMFEHKNVYLLGFGIVAGQSLSLTWLFQGMEKMKYMTIVNLISKLTCTLLIFILIKKPNHYIYVPLLYSIGFMSGGLLSLWIAFKQFDVTFYLIKKEKIIQHFKVSSQYFFSRLSVSFYTTSNNFIVGIIFGEFYAGIFGVAEKLYSAITIIYMPISDAIYPLMVKTKNIRLFNKIFLGAFLLNLFICLFTFIFSEEIIILVFGLEYIQASSLLRYFCFLALLTVPVILVGYPLLGSFGLEKYANNSVIIASIFHVILLLILHPFLTMYSMVLLLIFTQITVLSIRLIGIKILTKTLKKIDY